MHCERTTATTTPASIPPHGVRFRYFRRSVEV
jgi:hypothetical protein